MGGALLDTPNNARVGYRKLRVFISYSRDDLAFADQLDAALQAYGYQTSIDRESISGGVKWRPTLSKLIREADTVVFVLTPSSAVSDTCAWEVDEATSLGKRVVPVVARALEETSAPPRLRDLNYIFFYDEPKLPGSGFGSGLAQLSKALNTDWEWLGEHTRLLLRATEWDAGGRAENRLLFGSDIAAAKAWAERRPQGAPEPTSLHLDFIRASENAEAARENATRRAYEERERLLKRVVLRTRVALILLVCAIVGLVGWINQEFVKEQWRWYTVTLPYISSQVRSHVLSREAERALNPGDSFTECASDCPVMVVVRQGSFMMGSRGRENGRHEEEPQHEVAFAAPFAVSKFAVTFDEWDACVAHGNCDPPSDVGWGRGRRPVINVTWEEARRYVAWLTRITGKPYRLLSEAEWEYAARAGTQTVYPWGDDIGNRNANCKGCGSQWDGRATAPVGQFDPNAFGLFDMVGNVWQWLEDCAHESYDGAPSDGTAWTTAGECNSRVVRGGSYLYEPEYLRSARRFWTSFGNRNAQISIRVGRTLAH
ncbi:MAG: SUMF1/EgtB/PvdO family nonheme iron enzyme [Rhodomicrobium sp.]